MSPFGISSVPQLSEVEMCFVQCFVTFWKSLKFLVPVQSQPQCRLVGIRVVGEACHFSEQLIFDWDFLEDKHC